MIDITVRQSRGRAAYVISAFPGSARPHSHPLRPRCKAEKRALCCHCQGITISNVYQAVIQNEKSHPQLH